VRQRHDHQVQAEDGDQFTAMFQADRPGDTQALADEVVADGQLTTRGTGGGGAEDGAADVVGRAQWGFDGDESF
jgi:hypothetical protein